MAAALAGAAAFALPSAVRAEPPVDYLQRGMAGQVLMDDLGRMQQGGLVMSFVPSARGAPADKPDAAPLDRLNEVPKRLAACWLPPRFESENLEITVRLQFARDGNIIGRPRVTYVKAPDASTRDAMKVSLAAALARCTPLRFTPSLGGAIAGRPFAIRYILRTRAASLGQGLPPFRGQFFRSSHERSRQHTDA